MVATKETAVLTFAALGVAWLAARPALKAESRPRKSDAVPLVLAAVVTLAVAFTLLSGFFTHLRGPLGYFETYTPWLQRAGGTDLHRHPWHYYLSLLAWQRPDGGPLWTELLVLALAAGGAVSAGFPPLLERMGAQPAFPRFALVYTLALTAAYSLIPYKTPWNLLSFYLGFMLLAGLGAAAVLSLLRPVPLKAAAALLLLAGAGHLTWQSQRTTFDYRDDNTGPYAYAQPLRGVREIEERVTELAAFSPQKEDTVVQVVFTDDYHWPLPWYLRRLRNVGYWTARVPDERQARLSDTPIILSSAELDEELTGRLSASHFMTGFYSLRAGVLVQMWVKNELWEPFVMSRSRSPGG
jgi:predicted membrane-bound mannosyltransferase